MRFLVVFFFKQKTAYEMSLRDWSSDVCSSDLCLLSIGAIPNKQYSARGRVFPCRGCDRQQRSQQQNESQSQHLDTSHISHSSLPPTLSEEGKTVANFGARLKSLVFTE